jgi:large subunit ribosomal protein L24
MKPLLYKKSRRVRTQPLAQAVKTHVTKGDTVRVIRGEQRGTEGKVLRVYPRTNRVVVEGVNLVKRHKRATSAQTESGIIEFPAPIHLSNVMLLDPKTGDPTRVHRRVGKDGTAERVAKSGQVIPRVR